MMSARIAAWVLGMLAIGAAMASSQESDQAEAATPVFEVTFDVGIIASEKSAHVSIRLGRGSEPVEWIRFDFDPLRHRSIEADGELVPHDDMLEWRPPAGGGEIRYVFSIDHLREEAAYDARCTKSWAIFRGEELVPRSRIRTSPIARSRSRMRLRLPEGWGAAIPYARLVGGTYNLDDPDTRFDRPTGWFAFGKLGVVRETLEGTRITIAGPAGQGVRRMDALALLKWNLPAVAQLFGDLPGRFNVVIAGDPMWRGGLSGPRSAYLHVDRPLISENGTSPLLHEMVHSLMRARSGKDGDWIVEGLAEYYSIALLRRSETLTATRYESEIEAITERAGRGGDLRASKVEGATQAKAVVVLMEIDEAIRDATGGARSLDEVVRALTSQRDPITTTIFRRLVDQVAGRPLDEVFERHMAFVPPGTGSEANSL